MARTGDNPEAEESADETISPIGPIDDPEGEREAAVARLENEEVNEHG